MAFVFQRLQFFVLVPEIDPASESIIQQLIL